MRKRFGNLQKTAVINVVGLTSQLLARGMPRLLAWARAGRLASIRPALPAVTCTAQATYLTGEYPDKHGIVGNGWYVREESEVRFWRQSSKLLQSPRLWDTLRAIDPGFTCANLFWWFNMYTAADYTVTPRPQYAADGRKIPDIYTQPAGLRKTLQDEFGCFPLYDFWGPMASLRSSEWIADAAKLVETRHDPTLSLVYLPHLDYNLQRLGPDDPALDRDLNDIDAICTDLVAFYERRGARVIVLSEYGIVPVNQPVHINRVLRAHGLLTVREESGRELLDAGASEAFAVADHQVAHVYVNDPAQVTRVRRLLQDTPGIDSVLDPRGKREHHLSHPRAGDLVAVAVPGAWFTYYYWLDEVRAPDFARTVDIHRKPGYDPAELFIDPLLWAPKLKIGMALLKKRLGFRSLLEVIPLDATLVRGSHGRVPTSPAQAPLVITQQHTMLGEPAIDAPQVYWLILKHLSTPVGGPAKAGSLRGTLNTN